MTLSEMATAIHRWFDLAGQASGPILPDGWFGERPYENVFFLQNVLVIQNSLIIQLSDDTTVIFDNPQSIDVDNSQLAVGLYDKVTLRWVHFGGTQYRQLEYATGEVRFVPPLGTHILREDLLSEL